MRYTSRRGIDLLRFQSFPSFYSLSKEQELKELEAEMRIANDEYREALKEASEFIRHSYLESYFCQFF